MSTTTTWPIISSNMTRSGCGGKFLTCRALSGKLQTCRHAKVEVLNNVFSHYDEIVSSCKDSVEIEVSESSFSSVNAKSGIFMSKSLIHAAEQFFNEALERLRGIMAPQREALDRAAGLC